MEDHVFELRDVTIAFKKVRRVSLLYNIGSSAKRSKVSCFKALDGISLNISRGMTVGIIGKNGSGKTTLLRVLAGIYQPDDGDFVCNSDSISLLALGAGFDLQATGYDNIYLSALLGGHTKKEVNAVMEDIIQFADIGDFINEPIKTYSSGMRMRLAFSIAVQFKPEVLLIDEALSVGDAEFQKKSSEKMRELITDKNRTVVIVSHNLSYLKTMCQEVIWLEKGKVKMTGPSEDVINAYMAVSMAK
jgi:teichoic acid transport system ATP-binding protein